MLKIPSDYLRNNWVLSLYLVTLLHGILPRFLTEKKGSVN